MSRSHLFTSESVSEGHPDKVADQISDAILDALLDGDPLSRVACETLINTGMVVLCGEITSKTNADYTEVVRKTVNEIGYNSSDMGFDANSCAVIVSLDKQSATIRRQKIGQAVVAAPRRKVTAHRSLRGRQTRRGGYRCAVHSAHARY